MFVAEVASGLDAAVKAIDVIDSASFVKYLLGDFIVGTKREGRGAAAATPPPRRHARALLSTNTHLHSCVKVYRSSLHRQQAIYTGLH